MSSICVAVSGLNSTENPGPGLGVARSLKAAYGDAIRIVGLAYDANEPGCFIDRWIDHVYIMPYPSGDCADYRDRLLAIARLHAVQAVIPCLDAELPVYLGIADDLRAAGIASWLPSANQLALRSKERLPALAQAIGVAAPKTMVITESKDLHLAAAALGWPLWVKGRFYEAVRCHSMAEAIGAFSRIAGEWGYPIIVQGDIQGSHLNLVGVGNGGGCDDGLVAMKKSQCTKQGKIWTGVSVHHPALLQAAEQFCAQTRWRGAFELECIVDQQGTVHLLEINPRFPAWVWFATALGCNLPDRLLRRCLGQPVPHGISYPAGKLFVRHVAEHCCDLDQLHALAAEGELHHGHHSPATEGTAEFLKPAV